RPGRPVTGEGAPLDLLSLGELPEIAVAAAVTGGAPAVDAAPRRRTAPARAAARVAGARRAGAAGADEISAGRVVRARRRAGVEDADAFVARLVLGAIGVFAT